MDDKPIKDPLLATVLTGGLSGLDRLKAIAPPSRQGSVMGESKAPSLSSMADRIRAATSLEHLERMMTQAAGIGNTKTQRRVQAAYVAAKKRLENGEPKP